jgi:hypothetical protein
MRRLPADPILCKHSGGDIAMEGMFGWAEIKYSAEQILKREILITLSQISTFPIFGALEISTLPITEFGYHAEVTSLNIA